MAAFIISAIKIIFLLGFLIFIHEGGHFLAAKLSKVTVNEFSIGFGPKLLQSKKTKTKYCLRMIPLGGFVSMEGEVEKSDKPGSFSNASVLKRIFIVAAGGLVNIIFALAIYYAFAVASGNYIGTTVDYFTDDGIKTQEVGIQPGDEIIKINNKRVRFKDDIVNEIQKSNGNEVKVLIKRNNQKIEYNVKPVEKQTCHTGIYFSENTGSTIMAIEEGSPAEKYGLKEDDVILKVEGFNVDNDPYKFLDLVNSIETIEEEVNLDKKPNTKILHLLVSRKNEEKIIEIKADIVPTYVLGIAFKEVPNTVLNRVRYSFYDTGKFVGAIGTSLKELFTGKTSVKQLTGPVGISTMVSKTKGISQYIYFLALISLSLGVTNLLPFPPLDGGKIVLLIIEAITKKPIKENVEIGLQLVGFTLLIMLSLYVTYNDILKIF